jgi:hypothetical protein
VTWREAQEDDLDTCLKLHPHSLGHEIIGRGRAMAAWKELLRNPGFVCRVIEEELPGGKRRVLGFGSSVFVTPEFAEEEIRNPRSGIVSRIIAGTVNGEPVLLGRPEIARANADYGMDAVFLSTPWWDTSNALEFAEMIMAGVRSCVEAHAGYRLRSCMVEVSGEQAHSLGAAAGGFVTVKDFSDVNRVLISLRKEHAASVSTSTGNLLFHYREPVLGLGEADQLLLLAALRGPVDRQLADRMNLSLASVKKRWRSIFSKVEDRMPALFAGVLADREGKRGPQKRHLVLNYVREHPEELRPFAQVRKPRHATRRLRQEAGSNKG